MGKGDHENCPCMCCRTSSRRCLRPAGARRPHWFYRRQHDARQSARRAASRSACGLLIVGFEFEYANTPDDPTAAAPSLTTGMGNLLLQTPVALMGIQPYVTAGAGVYRETLGAHQDTSLGVNTGGGVKISLVGPVRLRVDYRVFKLGSGALNSPAQRIYAGLNLRF